MTEPRRAKVRAEASASVAADEGPRVTSETVMLTPVRPVSRAAAARLGAALFRAHPGVLSATYLVSDRTGRSSRVRIERVAIEGGGHVVRTVEIASLEPPE